MLNGLLGATRGCRDECVVSADCAAPAECVLEDGVRRCVTEVTCRR